MEYTKEQLKEFLKHEYSRIEGQLMENDLTKEEFNEIESLLLKIAKIAEINFYN